MVQPGLGMASWVGRQVKEEEKKKREDENRKKRGKKERIRE